MEKPFSAYRGEGPYVFICYAHADADKVFREIAWFHDYGVNAWFDEGITPGSEWTDELASAIQGCTQVFFFVTPNSVESEHCRRELNFAHEEGREVVAIHLQPTDVPPGLRLSLNNRQAVLRHQLTEDEFRKRLMRVADGGGGPSTPSTSTSGANASWSRSVLVTAAVALLSIAVGVWWLFPREEATVDAIPDAVAAVDAAPAQEFLRNSIAVLPFENLSPDPNNAYFAAGIHEEILNQLTKIKDLSVIARTTMVRYANSDMSVPDIGTELRVSTVMDGSVRYAGDRVRITAQLNDARTGVRVWSEAYEEDLEDIFGIQLDIATRIADTLKAEFSPTERRRVAIRVTDNPEAYAHYLRALSSFFAGFGPTGPVHEALDAATSLDPQFAAAWALKAVVYTTEATYGPTFVGRSFDANDQRRLIALAERHARLALELDEEQAFAHLAMSGVHFVNRNWEADFESTRRAYALNPSDYRIVSAAGWRQLLQGNLGEGFRLIHRSMELNPHDAAVIFSAARRHFWYEQWNEAAQLANLTIAVAPDAALGYAVLAGALAHTGDAEGVRANARMAQARNPGLLDVAILAEAYGQVGDLDSAQQLFDAAGGGDESAIPHLEVQFWMHLAVKQYDAAMGYLERAVRNNFPVSVPAYLHFHSNHPAFDAVRSHPSFDDLVRRAGMPVEQ